VNAGDPEAAYARRREAMVRDQLERRGIDHTALLAAFRRVPRHRFVPPSAVREAYADRPVEIGCGQTVSQPYMVALMLQRVLGPTVRRVLEVGTGSGYQTALLAELSSEVYTIERIACLSERAAATLRELGYANVFHRVGDGSLGWPEAAPFDAIVVAAGGPRVPQALKDQLAERGRLVIPVGDRYAQELILVERRGGGWSELALGSCVFVPLVGAEGWKPYAANGA